VLLHAIAGIVAELLGLYVVVCAGLGWLPARFRFTNYKPWMRLTLAAWLVAFGLGAWTYQTLNGGSADGIGLLAPRGWYCEGASGSSGCILLLSPKPIDRSAPGWKGFEGPAIEAYHISGENSGRYEIAEIIARVFPSFQAVAIRVLGQIDRPLPSGPYPKDTVTYKSKTVVEYNTPAQTEGLGTHFSWLKKSDTPVAGAAILIGDPAKLSLLGEQPGLLLLSVRLPPDLARLTAIVRDVERDVASTPQDQQ
jgi:hypothetical protein